MATPQGRGSHQQFFPDAAGHYHTGNTFYDKYYEKLDVQDAKIAADPRVQALLTSGGSGHVDKVPGLHDTDVEIKNGVVTGTTEGGIWKPIIAAAAVAATGGVAGMYVAPASAVAGPSTAANIAATTAATAAPAGIAAPVAGGVVATTAAPAYSSLLANQAVGIGGNLLSNYLQSRAQGKASEIQDAYLREALAYAKEQDALNRTRQTGLDQQDRDRYAYQTGIDAQHYGDTQQEYLADFDRNENRYAYSTDLEASRYGDYTKRVAPYLATGASANARMASLLGLPAAPEFDPSLTPGPVRKVSKPPVLSDPGSGFGGFSGGGGSGGGAQAPADVGAFIADYQRNHPASEGIGPLASALSAKFPGITRYMYGQTPSGNEISIGGQKYKVIGAEGGPNPYWYQPGTRDG
jgi:hypothetical protein